MHFDNLKDLQRSVLVHESFQNEIKGKRIKKELSNLEEYHHEAVRFIGFGLGEAGIALHIETTHNTRRFIFQLQIDFQYPFNRPQLFYINEDSPYAEYNDLLDTVLETRWSPSLLLNSILDKLPALAKHINEGNVKWVYHLGEGYSQRQLRKFKVNLFDVQEYEWKYMIKSAKRRKIGLTKSVLLKLSQQTEDLLVLDFFIVITALKQANATVSNGRFKLQIIYEQEKTQKTLYLGGREEDIQRILYLLNPIQVTERIVQREEARRQQLMSLESANDLIQKYSMLIEHYSLKDAAKSKRYVTNMQALISNIYKFQEKSQKREGNGQQQKQRELQKEHIQMLKAVQKQDHPQEATKPVVNETMTHDNPKEHTNEILKQYTVVGKQQSSVAQTNDLLVNIEILQVNLMSQQSGQNQPEDEDNIEEEEVKQIQEATIPEANKNTGQIVNDKTLEPTTEATESEPKMN